MIPDGYSHVICSSNNEFEPKIDASWELCGFWKRYRNNSFLRDKQLNLEKDGLYSHLQGYPKLKKLPHIMN